MMDSYDRQNILHHERLDAYTVAVELDGAVVAIAHKAGRGHAWIGDQVMRASASVVLPRRGPRSRRRGPRPGPSDRARIGP